MTDYVLDLGIVAFISWWQFAWWLSLVVMYIVGSVLPAVTMLFAPIHHWKDIFIHFEASLLFLVPFIGTLFGMHTLEDAEPFDTILHICFVVFVVSFFGMVIEVC